MLFVMLLMFEQISDFVYKFLRSNLLPETSLLVMRLIKLLFKKTYEFIGVTLQMFENITDLEKQPAPSNQS